MRYDLLIRHLSDYNVNRHINRQKKLENNVASFTYYPPFWRFFKRALKGITFDWQVLQYSTGAQPAVTANTPGIYLFVLNPSPVIFNEYNFIMYVGMTDEGLHERLNNGYRTPSKIKSRPNIHRLILDYGDFLKWYYLPLPEKSESELKQIEQYLIGYFGDPPINKKDAPFEISEAKKSKMN